MTIANIALSQLTTLVCLGMLSPLVTLIAEAKPPKKEPVPEQQRRPPVTNGRSAGSRGCAFETVAAPSQTFRLMMPPSGHMDLLAEQPTFGWTLGNRLPVAVVFRLYALGESLPRILVEEQLQDIPAQAQRLSYTMQQPLANGAYLWQVELVCDRDRPSGNIALEGQFRKIETPDQLQATLATTPTTPGKMNVLRTSGYWYDVYSHTLNDSEIAALGNGFAFGMTP